MTASFDGLPVGPALGFGAATLGNLHRAVDDDDARAMLEAVWAAGVRYFDTAPHYGLGLSERRLGAFLATKPRDAFVVSTKAGRLLQPDPDGEGLDTAADFWVPSDQRRVWDLSPEGLRRSLADSLERTGLDRIDVLYLHDPERSEDGVPVETAVEAMAGLRAEGLVDAVGVGSMDTRTLTTAARSGALDLLMVAGRFTLADQPALAEALPACAEHGTGVVVAAVFNSGLLASPRPEETGLYEYAPVPSDVLERVRAIAELCTEHGTDLPTAALQYVLRHPTVRAVVAGADDPAQLHQNLDRLTAPVPDALWTDLADRGLAPTW